MTPEKQEEPYCVRYVFDGTFIDGPGLNPNVDWNDYCQSREAIVEFGNHCYAQGAASRNAEVEALKAEVARFSRDANYWKWCNGCGSAKEDCEKWKDAGKVACCPECNHWPWNR